MEEQDIDADDMEYDALSSDTDEPEILEPDAEESDGADTQVDNDMDSEDVELEDTGTPAMKAISLMILSPIMNRSSIQMPNQYPRKYRKLMISRTRRNSKI